MLARAVVSRLAVFALVTCAITAASAQTGCGSLGLCRATSRAAAEKILSAWCERYTQCDPKRGTVDACVADRLSSAVVPSEDGCAGTCSEDTACHRSICSDERIETCKTDSFAMKCEAQLNQSLVVYPIGCDSCFN